MQRLNELGVRIEFSAVLEQAAGGAIGRPHVARAMIAEGWAVDFRDAFDRYLGNGRPAFVSKDRLAVRDAIGLIHSAGGLAVLAHPAQGATRERIAAFAAEGMDGVEVRHPSHSRRTWLASWRWSSIFRSCQAAGRIGMAPPKVRECLGMMKVPADWLARQDGRVGVRAA